MSTRSFHWIGNFKAQYNHERFCVWWIEFHKSIRDLRRWYIILSDLIRSNSDGGGTWNFPLVACGTSLSLQKTKFGICRQDWKLNISNFLFFFRMSNSQIENIPENFKFYYSREQFSNFQILCHYLSYHLGRAILNKRHKRMQVS